VNPRKYGNPPYSVILVHGGPGAPGEMASVAKELSINFGVLEPLQTKSSVNGQVEELKQQIIKNANVPVVLIGWSWGAWLSFIVTAENPNLVKKLILISSGPFKSEYAKEIMPRRLSRLSPQDKLRTEELLKIVQDNKKTKDNELLEEFGALMSKADSYNTLSADNKDDEVKVDMDIYNKVWAEADDLRKNGELLGYGKKIKCPVTIIHGEFDPHPYEGVRKPLSEVLINSKFILLEKCGHHPWFEKEARDKFYELLRAELIQD
jgi:pimeloyl-ACP methyl ester carboxylesterase